MDIKENLIFQVKQIIFGVQDGLVTTIILTTTLSAVSTNSILILSALTAGIGGAISMATGTYLGSKSQKEVLEIKTEDENIKEKAGSLISKNLKDQGVEKSDLDNMVQILSKYPDIEKGIASTLILGEDIEKTIRPKTDAVFMGISFLIGALIPTIPYIFLKTNIAVIFSILLVAISLFFIGFFKAADRKEDRIKNALEILIIGMIAAILGYYIGQIVK